MAKYEILKVNDKEIIFDVTQLMKEESVMINATKIASQFGKKPETWLRTQETQEYIKALTESLLKRENVLQQDLSLVRVQKGGKYSGTWIHSKLAIAFARWLDARFAVMCDEAIERMIRGEQQRKEERLKAKTGYAPLTLAIQSAHDEPKFYHFSNEANLINRIVIGKDANEFKKENNIDKNKSTRDFITAEQLRYINALQQYDAILIEIGHSYDERKDLLMEYYIKLLNKQNKLQNIKRINSKKSA